MLAVKAWGPQLRGKYFWIHVDNEAVAHVLNSGKGRDPFLQKALREIAFIAAQHEFVLKAKHIRGVDNRVPDWLSRWSEPDSRKKFRQYAREKSLKQIIITDKDHHIDNQW